MANFNANDEGFVSLGGKVTLELNELSERLLLVAGWTPPGQVHPVPPPRKPGAPYYQGDWVTLAHHEAALSALKDAHRRALDRDAEQLKVVHAAELRAARIKSSAEVRAEVAEEIARDLEKPREWRISPEEPAPWARVARAHARSKAAEDTRGLVCTMCYHLVSQHGRNGCSVITGSEALCRCREGHNR